MESTGNRTRTLEQVMHIVFLATATASIISVILISAFIFMTGIPTMAEIGLGEFLLGRNWFPRHTPAQFGIFPMIISSIYVTIGAIVLGVPLGLLTAIFLARFCPKNIYRLIKPAVELMAGIPSVVYGFFGMMVIVPLIRDVFRGLGFATTGFSMLAAIILLGIMILPTIIGLSEAAIAVVPRSYYEGAVALGASHERATMSIVVPAAKSGIFASIILGIGRAIGETMAVIMVAGGQSIMPENILSGVRTMTMNIVMEMGYAAGLHRDSLIATGAVLFVFILLINIAFNLIKRKVR
ncbi:MAG: phosphate ABC transporter permease subunit PstC [Tissierellia bacterium]|jgi:phosphate transport system permease protein|nr:phosphate ABC transporter permease subunit PstC [Tissierellia bacterium]